VSYLIAAAVLLGVGTGSLLHGLTERDWRSTGVGAGLTITSSVIAIITCAVMVVNA
jgi:hypothetical protein